MLEVMNDEEIQNDLHQKIKRRNRSRKRIRALKKRKYLEEETNKVIVAKKHKKIDYWHDLEAEKSQQRLRVLANLTNIG